jgi:DNA mismatch repair protein MutH
MNSVPELEKAGIEMKTITLTNTGRPKEHMSFPGFRFMDIIHEEWADSNFNEKIEKKFLLIVFQLDDFGDERLIKAGYWNMPYEDRLEARRVWEETKRRVAVNAKDLPKVGESYLAHVRPKARDGNDKIETPQGDMHVKQCFWLNQSYLSKVVLEQIK